MAMNVITIKKGFPVVHRQDKVMEWYLIQKGSVIRQYEFAEIVMGANSIIGILEQQWFACDYIAREDTTLIIIPCKNSDDLHTILKTHQNFRPIFLKTAVEQRHQALSLYAKLRKKALLLHSSAENFYHDYQNFCAETGISELDFQRMDHFEALSLAHKAENWEISSSNSLIQGYLRDYLQLMIRDDNLCVGAIMEASAQMHRYALGIEELANYLLFNRDILWSDSEDDVFHLYMDLTARLTDMGYDVSGPKESMLSLRDVMEQLDVYDPQIMDACSRAAENCQISLSDKDSRFRITNEDCVTHILTYAEYEKDEIREFKRMLDQYASLEDPFSTDKDVRALRKAVTDKFYEIYERAFFVSQRTFEQPSPILSMFFNFGFMDTNLLGVNETNELMYLNESLGQFRYTHVYTIYDWLTQIWQGQKEPSRNDFDLDYVGYLKQEIRQGNLSEEDFEEYSDDPVRKVRFEISNMFRITHRATSGRMSMFCPILTSSDVMGPFERMACTASKLEQAINRVRSLDYSVLYRKVLFSDPECGINQEWIQKEVMPDIILVPGIGARGVMWQEASGVKADTPARFVFPIFLSGDMLDQMMIALGRFRWEICRKIQGTYWNDYRERSLTSEYYDYIQFYRKNKDLSPEVKEKLKSTLSHARNNFREVFVMDYVNWLKYESAGSFRLNKVSRDIMIRYCPFSREIRETLATNPLYQEAFNKLNISNEKNITRLNALYNKYRAAGGEITTDLSENLKFYQL